MLGTCAPRPVVWACTAGLVAVSSLTGCSLIFDGGSYEGDAGGSVMDAGLADASVADAGARDSDAGPGDSDAGPAAGRECSTHLDCLESPAEADYVCRPRSMEVGPPFFCAPECEAEADCGPIGGGDAHEDGAVCVSGGFCGCWTDADCPDPGRPQCDTALELCVECTRNMDCDPPRTQELCFQGACTQVRCPGGPNDCNVDGAGGACLPAPMGAVCSDFCMLDTECPGDTACRGVELTRRRCE